MRFNVKMSFPQNQFNAAQLDGGDVIPITTTTTTPAPIPANSTGLSHYMEKNEKLDSGSSLEVRTFLEKVLKIDYWKIN